MKTFTLSLPLFGLAVGTRAMAGAGLALLLAGKLDPSQRKAVGWTLLGVGVATTFPIAAIVLSKACGGNCPEKES